MSHCPATPPQGPRLSSPAAILPHTPCHPVWGAGSRTHHACGVAWLCKALAHLCLGENMEGCQPRPGNQAEKPGVRVEPTLARPTWERPRLRGGCQG